MLKGAGKKSDHGKSKDDFIFDLDLSGEETGSPEALDQDQTKAALDNALELESDGEDEHKLPKPAKAPAQQSSSVPIAIERKFTPFFAGAKQDMNGLEEDDEDDELAQGTPVNMFEYHLQQSKSVTNHMSCSPPGMRRRVPGVRGNKK